MRTLKPPKSFVNWLRDVIAQQCMIEEAYYGVKCDLPASK